jgi:flagellar hook-associated protein FlgK
MNSVFSVGVQGIQTGYEQLRESAHNVANMNQGSPEKQVDVELPSEAVNQIEAKQQVQASAKVIERADDALGSLIDIVV